MYIRCYRLETTVTAMKNDTLPKYSDKKLKTLFISDFYIKPAPIVSRHTGPEVIKLLSMKFVLLKLLTTANSFLLNIAEHEKISANKYENAKYCWHFHIYQQRKFHPERS